MSDTGRKDLGDKVSDKVTPDSHKSTLDKVGETISGGADKAARDTVPDSQKSTSQSLADKASRGTDSHSHKDDSVLDKAKSAVGLDKH